MGSANAKRVLVDGHRMADLFVRVTITAQPVGWLDRHAVNRRASLRDLYGARDSLLPNAAVLCATDDVLLLSRIRDKSVAAVSSDHDDRILVRRAESRNHGRDGTIFAALLLDVCQRLWLAAKYSTGTVLHHGDRSHRLGLCGFSKPVSNTYRRRLAIDRSCREATLLVSAEFPIDLHWLLAFAHRSQLVSACRHSADLP